MNPWGAVILEFLLVIIILIAIKAALERIRLSGPPGARPARYRLRDDFMSRAEAGFYHQLCATVSSWAIVFPKVNLADLFYAAGGVASSRLAAWNRINRKHVDYVLCHPQTLQPIMAVELDDSSHAKPRRIARDQLVDDVFAQAGLAIAHIPLQAGYTRDQLEAHLSQARSAPVMQPDAQMLASERRLEQQKPNVPFDTLAAESAVLSAPTCPKCGTQMVRRVAQRGRNAGAEFWGCANYPHCRGIRQL